MKQAGTTKIGRNSFGWYIQMMARLVESETQSQLKPFRLSVPEFSTLLGLFESDGATQSELGRLTGAPEYSTSRYVDRLVDKGMVERKPHPKTRRAVTVYLTKIGKEKSKEMMKIKERVNNKILSGLENDERNTLEDLLMKAIDSLT